MLIVDDGVFDQLHFIVDPGAKLEIMGRSLLLQRTKVSQSVVVGDGKHEVTKVCRMMDMACVSGTRPCCQAG